MPVLSSPSTWRTHPYSYRGYVFLLNPDTVFAARVNMSSGNYPIDAITYDGVTTGAYTDLQVGMTVLFGTSAGADDLGRTYVRLTPTDSILYVGRSSQGTRDGEITVQNDAYITVLDDYRIWAKIPYIGNDGTLYKDSDVVVGTNGTQPPPVANAGPGYAEFVDDSDVITVQFDAGESFAIDTGASISGYSWDVADGTITVGADTDEEITATFPPGFRWVRLTVTDSNGKTHTAVVPVFAAEPSGSNAPLDGAVVERQLFSKNGQRLTLTLRADVDIDTYPDGTLVLYWERERYGSTVGSLAGYSGREHMKFIGWLHNEPTRLESGQGGVLGDTTVECLDVAGRLALLPAFPQVLESNANANEWTEIQALTPDRFIWYLLHWHSTALTLADYLWSGTDTTYALPRLQCEGASLWENAAGRAQAMEHDLTCDPQGRLLTVRDPILEATGSRTSTVIVDIDETDWTTLGYSHMRHPRVHWLRGAAFEATTSTDIEDLVPRLCIAPGFSPGQGLDPRDQSYQVVEDQDELNAREGNRYARMNAEEGMFDVGLAHAGDAGISPAFGEWVRLTISAMSGAQRGLTFADERFLPVEVSISHDHRDGTKTVHLTVEREVEGAAATTVIPNLGAENAIPSYDVFFPSIPTIATEAGENLFWLKAGTATIAAFNFDGYVYRTANWNDVEPFWDRVDLGLNLAFRGMEVDPFSPLYVGAGTTVNCYVIDRRYVYYVEDVFEVEGAITVTQVYDIGANSDIRTIHASFGQQGLVGIADPRGNPDGTYLVWTTDGHLGDGATWNADQISAFYITTGGADDRTGVFARGDDLIYLIARYEDSGNGRLYEIDVGAGPSITNLGNSGGSREAGLFHMPYHNGQNDIHDGMAAVTYWLGVRNAFSTEVGKKVAGAYTDESPTYSGNPYGMGYTISAQWLVYSYPLDMDYVIAALATTSDYQVFFSNDRGDNWTHLDGSSNYKFAGISGFDPNVAYLCGGSDNAAKIGFVADLFSAPSPTIMDKLGNILVDYPDADAFYFVIGG